MKTWHVYYLPYAIRKCIDGTIIQGKVGQSYLSINQRKRLNHKQEGLDVTDHVVLVDNIPTLEEALRLEYRYQQILRCVDGVKRPGYSEYMKSRMKGMTQSEETKRKRKKSLEGRENTWNKGITGVITHSKETRDAQSLIALNRPKSPCPYCGKLFTINNMSTHMAACKHRHK
jgi:hypothetical protein